MREIAVNRKPYAIIDELLQNLSRQTGTQSKEILP